MRCLLLSLSLLLAACTGEMPAPAESENGRSKPIVFAANYPLYFFAQQIAGETVDIRLPEFDGDPAFWKPNGEQVAALQGADMVVLNGAGYENWLNFVTLHADRLLDTTANLGDRLLPLEEAAMHRHGPEGEHSHHGIAFTTWLDPQLAIEQARVIAEALSGLQPDGKADYMMGLEALERRLTELDRELQRTFGALEGRPVVFSHPVYQYLQHRYGINGRSLHWEPGEDPGVRAWLDFQNLLREHPAGLLIWEDEPLPETARKLEEAGVESLVFDPAAYRPASGDYFDVMTANISRLNLASD
jgi:zinc transport system substrate-binding protein